MVWWVGTRTMIICFFQHIQILIHSTLTIEKEKERKEKKTRVRACARKKELHINDHKTYDDDAAADDSRLHSCMHAYVFVWLAGRLHIGANKQ